MAKYHYRGPGLDLFSAQSGGSLKGRPLYVDDKSFGLLNPDGSKSYYFGKDLAWDAEAGQFTEGTVTAIYHFDQSGPTWTASTGCPSHSRPSSNS